jgi:hypothetical protein
VEEDRPNLFTQRLGNIPASTDVTVELTIDHLLAWISDVSVPRHMQYYGRRLISE